MENSISVKEIGAIKDEFYLTENNGYTLSFKITNFEGKEMNLDDLGLKCTSVMYLDEGEINSQDVPSKDGKLQLNVKADTLKDQNETELRLFFYEKSDNKPSIIKNFKIKPNYSNNSVIVWDYAIEMGKAEDFSEEFYNVLKGAKGDKGEKGDTGAKGEKGEDGKSPTATVTNNGDSTHTITIINSDDTVTKTIVKDGIKGDKGVKGDKGEDGKDGINGKSVTAETVQGTNETGNKGSWVYVYEVNSDGARGSLISQTFIKDGVDGINGKDGEKGEQGVQGIQGIKGEQGIKGDKGEKGDSISTTVYNMYIDMLSPFEGKKLFISYNQLMVSIILQGNADGKTDNIKSTDNLIAKLPDNVPLPKTEFVRGTITTMTGGEEVQYIGNIFMDNKRNIYVKFNKNASGVKSYFGGSLSYPVGDAVVNFNTGIVKSFEFDNPSFLSMQGTDYFENYVFSAINEQKGDIQKIKYINTLNTNDKGTLTNLDSNFSSLVGHANSLKVAGKIGGEILIYAVKTGTPDVVPIYVNMANKTTRVGTGIITVQDGNSSVKRIISINSINLVGNNYVFDVYWYGVNFNFKIDKSSIDTPTSVVSTKTFEISESDIAKVRKDKIGDFENNVRVTQGTRVYGNYFYLTQYTGVTSSVFKFEIVNNKLEYRNHWVVTKGHLDRFEIQDIFKINEKVYIAISEQTLTGKYDNYISEIVI